MAQLTSALTSQGALIAVEVGVPASLRGAVDRAGRRIPSVSPVVALIDTGASHTLIDRSLVVRLGLSSVAAGRMRTPSSGPAATFVSQYDVDLLIAGSQGRANALEFLNLRVSAAELYPANPFHILLGRDVLAHCVLIHNGLQGVFTLTF